MSINDAQWETMAVPSGDAIPIGWEPFAVAQDFTQTDEHGRGYSEPYVWCRRIKPAESVG